MTVAGERFRVDTDKAVELAVPLDFDGVQPRAFGMPRASAEVVEGGGFVGDTRRGGSVNCETVELTAHGNGTHTEGVGHITDERISVGDALPEPVVPATVLTMSLASLGDVDEGYEGQYAPTDRVVTRRRLADATDRIGGDDSLCRAVIIGVDSSEAFDPRADHSGTNPPYLTSEAIQWLRDVGCDHLLVEFPSVDREDDGGGVPNHHRFFGVEPGRRASEQSRRRTITELIDIPTGLDDGLYALSLRFPRFCLDAAPSRPVIYPLQR